MLKSGRDHALELRVAAREVGRCGLKEAVVVMREAADELDRQRVELELGYGGGERPREYIRRLWWRWTGRGGVRL